MANLKAKRAFTLMELLIVITIIGILVATGTVSWFNAQQKGRDSRRKSDLKSVQQALELYYQTNGKYPSSSTGRIQCNVTGDSTVKAWGTATFSCTTITYMQRLPQDPTVQSTNGFYYTSSAPNNTYTLSANLENTLDPDKNNLPCTPQSGRNYCVINP